MNTAKTQDTLEKKPVPRRRRVVLVLMTAASITLVMGIVLLSNDMRHLRNLAARFGYQLPSMLAEPEKPATVPVPTARRMPSDTIMLPANLLAEPSLAAVGAFVSGWRISGPDICDRLKRVGLNTGAWGAAQFSDKAYECSFENIYERDGDAIESSFYFVVRGNEQGRIVSIRAKLVKPPRDNAGRLAPTAYGIFEEIFLLVHWPDCKDASTALRLLKNVRATCSGKTMSLTQEVMNPGSYNFFLSLTPTAAGEKRTTDYFTADLWLPGRDAPPSDTPDIALAGRDPTPPAAADDKNETNGG